MPKNRYTLEDFFFELPRELIAQYPADKRDLSRLFILDRTKEKYIHSLFNQLPGFLYQDDLLVLNDTKVIHAKIPCRRISGGNVVLLLTKQVDDKKWEAISNRTKRLKPGERIHPLKNGDVTFTVLNRFEDQITVESDSILTETILDRIGGIALPPYIKRKVSADDENRYQTVYARKGCAIAAPTAGLHFTGELMKKISAAGARTAFVTLDVSWGTFQPVRTHYIENHKMHSERFALSENAASSINLARKNGKRIIAVGTTALRVLESTYVDGVNVPGNGETDIFIYPPMQIKSIDALITNFHTPYSTLLMLVSAFAGYDAIMKAYREAIEQQYRFFSYGDAMFMI